MLTFGWKYLLDATSWSVLVYLQSCPLLTKLTLDTPLSEISSTYFISLEPLLVNKLKVLTLVSLALNSSAAKTLSQSLQLQHCSLVTLTLERYHFRNNAFKELAIGIGRNTSLHRIAFYDCQLASADLKILADALRHSKTLEEVEIWQLHIDVIRAMVVDKAAIQALKECNKCITFKVSV